MTLPGANVQNTNSSPQGQNRSAPATGSLNGRQVSGDLEDSCLKGAIKKIVGALAFILSCIAIAFGSVGLVYCIKMPVEVLGHLKALGIISSIANIILGVGTLPYSQHLMGC